MLQVKALQNRKKNFLLVGLKDSSYFIEQASYYLKIEIHFSYDGFVALTQNHAIWCI